MQSQMNNRRESILAVQQEGDCYRLLAVCFYEPDAAMFLEEKVCESLQQLLEKVCPPAALHPAKMLDALRDCGENELEVEYARLFIGPFELPAPPYGSVYLDEGGRIMGDSTLETMTFYQEAGLCLEEELNEPADHIAIELEFMHFLSLNSADALDQKDKERADFFMEIRSNFMSRLLGGWVGLFCERIKRNSTHEFYRSLAKCLEEVITCTQANSCPREG